MMNKLNGKTILIGREPDKGRLCVAVDGKVAALGNPGCVPSCVSRCKVQENVAHAKIEVSGDGKMTITNMKPNNQTFVDGVEVMSKTITAGSKVALGKDRYVVHVNAIMVAAEKIVVPGEGCTPPPTAEYNITHLKRVWDDYHDKTVAIKKHSHKLGLMSSAGMLFTFGGGALTALGGQMGLGGFMKDLMPFLTAIGGIVFILSFVLRSRDKTIENTEKITEDFQEHYVCPNPKCNKFLGNLSYKLLIKQYKMQCPYCKCKYVEN